MSDWKPAHAPTFDTRESLSTSRGDRVLIFSDFDRAEPHFVRVSNLVDFHYFSIFFDIFRTYTHLTIVQNCLPKRLGVAWGLRERSTCAQPVNICRYSEGPWAQKSMNRNSAARAPVVNGLRQEPDKSGIPNFDVPIRQIRSRTF